MGSREILMDARRAGKFLLALAGMCELLGCAVGPKYKAPTAPTSPAYKEMGNWKTAQPNDQTPGRKLVGNLQRSSTECFRRTDQRLQPEPESRSCPVPGSSGRSALRSCRLLSDHHGLAISYA